MFRFRTNHQPPPRTAGRLRVVPLFSLAWKRRGEDEEEGRGRRGRARDSERRGEDFERKEEDGRGRNGTRRRKKPGLGTGQNKGFEKEETMALRRRKKGIGNHVILKGFFRKMQNLLTTLTTLTTFPAKATENETFNGGVIFRKNGTTTHNNSQHFLVSWANVVRCCERVG